MFRKANKQDDKILTNRSDHQHYGYAKLKFPCIKCTKLMCHSISLINQMQNIRLESRLAGTEVYYLTPFNLKKLIF